MTLATAAICVIGICELPRVLDERLHVAERHRGRWPPQAADHGDRT
jgi:hypothetical protein